MKKNINPSCLILMLTLAIFGHQSYAQKQNHSKEAFEIFLSTKMDSMGIPGISCAIIENHKIKHHFTLGTVSKETGLPVDKNTLFDAGSLSKTPFSFLTLKVVSEGKLNQDDLLYKYLEVPDLANDSRRLKITPKMVLSHTSGFPNWRRFNADKKLDIKFEPGTAFLYSGEGYEYMASVLSNLLKVTKNDLNIVFKQKVAMNMGMDKAEYVWSPEVEKHRAAGHFEGKVSDGWGISKQNPDFYAAYSLQTEAKSYAGFLISLFESSNLPVSLTQLMLSDIVSENETKKWGLGIANIEKEGLKFYTHSGYNKNFSAFYVYESIGGNGYVFFINCEKAMQLGDVLNKYIWNMNF